MYHFSTPLLSVPSQGENLQYPLQEEDMEEEEDCIRAERDLSARGILLVLNYVHNIVEAVFIMWTFPINQNIVLINIG